MAAVRSMLSLPVIDERPRTRAECRNGIRPCPFVSCRYHLAVDLDKDGTLKVHHDDVAEMEQTCALDVAEQRDGLSLAEVGALMHVTRERIRQLEAVALRKIRESTGEKLR